MKRSLTILAAALAVGCARPPYVTKSDTADAYVKGRVAHIGETLFDNPADTDSLPPVLGQFDTHTVVEYNRAGNVTRVDSFKGPDSMLITKEEYLYNPSGERLERALTYNPARNGAPITVIYEYDKQGRLTSEAESNGFYRYDHRYDRHGYPKAQTTVSPESGKRVVTARYIYDREGRLKRQRGERRQRYVYRPGGVVSEIREGRSAINFHNDRGYLEAMAVRIDRKDLKGRTFERFSVTLTADYEYDAHGNWIRRVMRYLGEVQSVALREIEYYNQ